MPCLYDATANSDFTQNQDATTNSDLEQNIVAINNSLTI